MFAKLAASLLLPHSAQTETIVLFDALCCVGILIFLIYLVFILSAFLWEMCDGDRCDRIFKEDFGFIY